MNRLPCRMKGLRTEPGSCLLCTHLGQPPDISLLCVTQILRKKIFATTFLKLFLFGIVLAIFKISQWIPIPILNYFIEHFHRGIHCEILKIS